MSAFTDAEIEFLNSQRLGRLATVGADDMPHVGGEDVSNRLGAPFRFAPAWIRIRPRRIVALGINGGQFESSARDVA
jgi:hypothetical protein